MMNSRRITTTQVVRTTTFLHPLPSNHNLHHSRPGEFIAIRSFIFITLNEQAYCRARSNSRTQKLNQTV